MRSSYLLRQGGAVSNQFNSIQFNSIQFNSIQFDSIRFDSIRFIGLDGDDLVNNNRSRPFLPVRPVRPVGARQPLNWNVSPKSPEGRIPYEGATGIKPNETKRGKRPATIGELRSCCSMPFPLPRWHRDTLSRWPPHYCGLVLQHSRATVVVEPTHKIGLIILILWIFFKVLN